MDSKEVADWWVDVLDHSITTVGNHDFTLTDVILFLFEETHERERLEKINEGLKDRIEALEKQPCISCGVIYNYPLFLE